VVADPTEPVTLCRYLEFEISRLSNNTVVQLADPMIRNAIQRCCEQIEGRVNLPGAWSSLAIFHLLLGQPYDALNALARLVTLCESRPTGLCAAGRAVHRLHETLNRIDCVREKLRGFAWFERALQLILAVRLNDDPAHAALLAAATRGSDDPQYAPGETVIILAGACSAALQQDVERFAPCWEQGTEGLSFTLVSGGTRAGISGLAGALASRSAGRVRAIGYLPVGAREDAERYSRLPRTPGTEFSPMEPLQAWTDLVAAGVAPARVKLIAYAGEQISDAECALALALGARVAVVDDPLLPEDRQFRNPDWQDHQGLVRLPLDAMTLRAFLLVDEIPCERPEFETAARLAHRDYVNSAKPKDPSLAEWQDLTADLKVSNYHQVAYAEDILRTVGLGVRPLTDPAAPLLDIEKEVGPEAFVRLAIMEHGRWNVERLLRGWHYADTKDVSRKLSPYLVPWKQLADDIQAYDLGGIRGLPEKLQAAGLEIYRLIT
jgi:hypothetical protein